MNYFSQTKILLVPSIFVGATSLFPLYAQQKPNVLLIITDDQGIGDFGFMNPLVSTPNIDRLASESALYTNFVAAPASSPSRVSIYTGRNHLLTGVWGVPPRSNCFTDEVFMPQFFKTAGYNTYLLGKRDMSQSVGCDPWEYGWDNGYTVQGYQQKDPRMETKTGSVHKTGYTSEIMCEEAIRFINEQGKQPWMLSLNFITPHMPWICSPEFAAPYKAKGYSDNLSSCWGAITQMDHALGKVLELLRQKGIEKHTLIMLYSDNGATSPEVQKLVGKKEQQVPGEDWKLRNALGLRGYKSSTYENGMRVPFLFKLPKVIESGKRAQFARVEDILPTVLELVQINPSVLPHQPFTGVSIAKNLIHSSFDVNVPPAFRINIAHEGSPRTRKGIIPDPRKLVYEEHHLVLQNSRYKYHNLPSGQHELYDRLNDPSETVNLLTEKPEMAQEMAKECHRQWESVINSGRAFIMPELLIGRTLWNGQSESTSVLSAGYVQSFKGEASQAGQQVRGFMKTGDEAHYSMRVATPGRYQVSIQGADFDECMHLNLRIGEVVLNGKRVSPSEVEFGYVDLNSTSNRLSLYSEDKTSGAKCALIKQFIFKRID